MRKIPSLFIRDEKTHRATPIIAPGCHWVGAGHGIATRKLDGTAVMIRDGRLFKRYDAKIKKWCDGAPMGAHLPVGFEACQVEPDRFTGHYPGWVPVGDGPEDRWHREARLAASVGPGSAVVPAQGPAPDGTYELCGPRINGNPERLAGHWLIPHGFAEMGGVSRNFEALRVFLAGLDIEGIVWHHPDGLTMAKVKLKDFGLRRPA